MSRYEPRRAFPEPYEPGWDIREAAIWLLGVTTGAAATWLAWWLVHLVS